MPVEVSYQLDLNSEIPEDLVETAVKQGEDSSKVCEYLDDFRRLIYEKGTVTPHRMDDEYLIKFLRARFFKIDNAYKLLCRYYEFRKENKTLFENVHPLTLTRDYDIISVFPYREQYGRRMIIYKIGNWQPAKTTIDEVFRATIVLLELGSLELRGQILGGIGILDLEGLSLNHVWHLSPSVAQKLINILVTSMPIRTAAIHIINQNWVFDTCFQMFKPFLNDRMKKQIFIHGHDMKSLHKHVSPSHLPQRYGGTLSECTYTNWMGSLAYSNKVLDDLRSVGYILTEEDIEEAKRVNENKNKI